MNILAARAEYATVLTSNAIFLKAKLVEIT